MFINTWKSCLGGAWGKLTSLFLFFKLQTLRPVPPPRRKRLAKSNARLPKDENIGPHFEFPTPTARTTGAERLNAPIPALRGYIGSSVEPVPAPSCRSPTTSKTKLPNNENIVPPFEFPTPTARGSPERSTSPIPAPRSYIGPSEHLDILGSRSGSGNKLDLPGRSRTKLPKYENIGPHFDSPTPTARGSPERLTSPIPAPRSYIGSSEAPVPAPRCRHPAPSKSKEPQDENIGPHFEFLTPPAKGNPECSTSSIPAPRSYIGPSKELDVLRSRSGSGNELDLQEESRTGSHGSTDSIDSLDEPGKVVILSFQKYSCVHNIKHIYAYSA